MRLIMSSIILTLALLLASCKGAASSGTPAWVTSTLAGSGTAGDGDGTGTAAQFNSPRGVDVDSRGYVYVADYSNHRIRRITPAGKVDTLAGSGTAGDGDGTGTAAQFNGPTDVAVDVDLRNNEVYVYVADTGNNLIRKITITTQEDGQERVTVSTLAGGTQGFADATGTAAQFHLPLGVAVDSRNNKVYVYVADYLTYRTRRITSAGEVSTLAGSTQGFADATGTAAQFINPSDVAVDTSGNVYVADYGGNRIRKITITTQENGQERAEVSTLAGSGAEGHQDGAGTAAQFNDPHGVAVNSSGNAVYVAERTNHRIRKITITTQENGQERAEVSTLAGSGTAGDGDGTGTAAQFNDPYGVAVNSSGNAVYVADTDNHRIRKIEYRVP